MIMLLSCHISSKWHSRCRDQQLAVDATQRNQITAIKILSITNPDFRTERHDVSAVSIRKRGGSHPGVAEHCNVIASF
jgi:hypothetical protein